METTVLKFVFFVEALKKHKHENVTFSLYNKNDHRSAKNLNPSELFLGKV